MSRTRLPKNWSVFAFAIGAFWLAEAVAESMLIDETIDESALPAWLVYGGSKLANRDRVKPYRYTFDEEHRARAAAAQIWSELGKGVIGPDAQYLTELLAVKDAGFMREYVWVYLRDQSWAEPEHLRLAEFEEWRTKNLENHTVQTRVLIK